jgi:stress response protein YsnF
MTTTVIGTIGDAKSARQLVNELVEAGFKKQDVELLEGSEQQILATIVERGFAEDDARGYAQAVRGGKTLVATRTPEAKVERAVAIIERYESAAGAGAEERGETVQEVEEELSVGKRKVATGGVRVTTSVSETPVEETVTLREEQVEAKRRPADRKLSPEEAEAAFENKTVEMLGTSEQAAVRKEARVVGEVAVGKQVEEREKTVKDTVRRTEVEVEEIGAKARKAR